MGGPSRALEQIGVRDAVHRRGSVNTDAQIATLVIRLEGLVVLAQAKLEAFEPRLELDFESGNSDAEA